MLSFRIIYLGVCDYLSNHFLTKILIDHLHYLILVNGISEYFYINKFYRSHVNLLMSSIRNKVVQEAGFQRSITSSIWPIKYVFLFESAVIITSVIMFISVFVTGQVGHSIHVQCWEIAIYFRDNK